MNRHPSKKDNIMGIQSTIYVKRDWAINRIEFISEAEKFGFHSLFIFAGILNIIGTIMLISLYPYIKILRRPEHHKTLSHKK
jgi:hypothetical protein